MYGTPDMKEFRRIMLAERARRERRKHFLLTVASVSLLGATVFFSSWYW
jgi:hypothetical protein